MPPGQIQFNKRSDAPWASIALTIFGLVLGVMVILPILLLLLVVGFVVMVALGILSLYARVVNMFRGFAKQDHDGRKNVRIRKTPTDAND